MAIKYIGQTWRDSLETFPQDHRVYIDFRQKRYPIVEGNPTYSLVDDDSSNSPGSYNLSGGYPICLIDMQSTFTIDIYFKEQFLSTVGSKQYLFGWNGDPGRYLYLFYNDPDSKYYLYWCNGSTPTRYLATSEISGIGAFKRMTLVIDLTTDATTGSTIYINGSPVATEWNDIKGVKDVSINKLFFRSTRAVTGDYDINYFRLIPGYKASAADVANNFKDVLDEEVIWTFDGHPTGRTRCNVSSRVNRIQLDRSVASFAGNSNANKASVTLMSPAGQFADDQYAAWDPASEVYNGTSSQKYMQNRCPVEIETWSSNLFETEFIGRLDDDCFKRRSGVGVLSTVQLSAYDAVEDFRRRVRQKAYTYEDYELSNTTTSTTSLLHVIAKMETQKEWYNYLANSSFENTTVANSWTVAGTSATITRASGGLLGSYQGDFLCTTTATLKQTVEFDGRKRLNVGENWNYSIYGKSATGGTITLSIDEMTSSGTSLASVSTTLTLVDSWAKVEMTCTISTSATDSLLCTLSSASAYTASLDCAMLIQRAQSLDWFVLNDNDGTAGVTKADNADSQTYDDIGIDADDAMVTHPWAIVEKDTPIWGYLQKIGVATAARYIGMDACGTFKYRSIFKTGYVDPPSLLTISSVQNIQSAISLKQANKIVVKGVMIQKDDYLRTVWDAVSCGAFAQGQNSNEISEAVANNGYWPAASTYGEFWAAYDDLEAEGYAGISGTISGFIPRQG